MYSIIISYVFTFWTNMIERTFKPAATQTSAYVEQPFGLLDWRERHSGSLAAMAKNTHHFLLMHSLFSTMWAHVMANIGILFDNEVD